MSLNTSPSFQMPEKITSLLLVRRERCKELLRNKVTYSTGGWGSWLMSMVQTSSTREKNIHSPPDPHADRENLAKLREAQKRTVAAENDEILEAIRTGKRGERVHRLLSDDIRNDRTQSIFTAARNPQIPAASTALTMEYAPNKGRYYVANRDIEPGTQVSHLVSEVCLKNSIGLIIDSQRIPPTVC